MYGKLFLPSVNPTIGLRFSRQRMKLIILLWRKSTIKTIMKGYTLTPLFCSILVTIVYMLLIPFSIVFNTLDTAFAQTEDNQPNINATSVFDTGQMILGNNIKHLVILIPDEGHHGPGEEDEARFIAQPFVPQNAVVTLGTQVVWFSGDVGHDHNIVVRDTNSNNNTIFETGQFPEFEATRAITFNNTGTFDYADTIDYEGGFRMTGDITVVSGGGNSIDTSGNTFDTVGVLMVPSMMVQDVVNGMRSSGFGIDSMHNFKDLRGGQSDTGDEQTLVIWTANGMHLNEIGSRLQAISEPLQYE
jgi:plastocyanin